MALKRARDKRDEARALLAEGVDPGMAKLAQKLRQRQLADDSREAIAREWFERRLADKSANHRDKVVRRLERDVFPYLGSRPVAELKAPDILAVARKVEGRGALDPAHRVIQNIGDVMRYAIATGRAEADPTPALRGALLPARHRHCAAPTDDPGAVAGILRMFDALTATRKIGCGRARWSTSWPKAQGAFVTAWRPSATCTAIWASSLGGCEVLRSWST